jgi:hypothetical protein
VPLQLGFSGGSIIVSASQERRKSQFSWRGSAFDTFRTALDLFCVSCEPHEPFLSDKNGSTKGKDDRRFDTTTTTIPGDDGSNFPALSHETKDEASERAMIV